MEKLLRTALATLALLAVFAAGWWASAAAQVQFSPTEPNIISGMDIGFRVDRTIKGVPHGKLVVRVNGDWVEPAYTPTSRLLTQ